MKQITVYSLPNCHFCHQAKDFLTSRGLEFTDYNVGEDQSKLQEMFDKTGQMGAPVIDIEGDIVVGFNRELLEQLLAEV